MSTLKEKTKEERLKADIALLDKLLGVEARKPGKAASLPAAIRIIEDLEPAGGKDVPVFPASYLGDDDNPTYDLAGIEYGEVAVRIQFKDRERFVRPILRARLCAIDSAQAQANRNEPAFIEADDLKELVPQAQATLPRKGGATSSDNVLNLPHRVADFRVRLSNQESKVKTAISSFKAGNALLLLRLMPTSVVFGFWDSRGDEGTKHARILLTRIDAHDVVPCRRHAVYNGPYSQDEFAEAILNDLARASEKKDTEKMSGEGFTNALGEALGGVIVNGPIERLALLSLTDIARINCWESPVESDINQATSSPAVQAEDKSVKSSLKTIAASVDLTLTNAARRYIFALAALAESHPRSTGSHRLRSGCELIAATQANSSKKSVAFSTRGAALDEHDSQALERLYFDRERLIAVAKDAKVALNVPPTLPDFEVTTDKLAEKFGSKEDDKATKEAEKAAAKAKKEADKAAAKVAKGTKNASSEAPKP
jgi:CRISPR-associated protein Csb1